MFDWTELETLLRHFRTAASDAGQSAGPVIVRINDPVTETPVADRKPLSGAPEQIRDDLQRLQTLGVEGVMWDLTAAPSGLMSETLASAAALHSSCQQTRTLRWSGAQPG